MRRKSKQQKLTWCAHKEEEATLSERDQQTTTLDEKHAHDTLTTHKTLPTHKTLTSPQKN